MGWITGACLGIRIMRELESTLRMSSEMYSAQCVSLGVKHMLPQSLYCPCGMYCHLEKYAGVSPSPPLVVA